MAMRIAYLLIDYRATVQYTLLFLNAEKVNIFIWMLFEKCAHQQAIDESII